MRTLSIEHANENPYVVFSNNDLAIIRSMHDLGENADEQILIDGFVLMLVKKGHATIEIDNDMFELKVGNLFACRPRNIIDNVMISLDAEVSGIFCTTKFASWVLNETNIDISEFLLTRYHNIAILSEEEQCVFLKHINLIDRCLELSGEKPHKTKSLLALFTSLAWQVIDFENIGDRDIKDGKFSSSELIFKSFMKMLALENGPILDVQGYAEKLHITPKYFSAICKHESGMTASKIISDYVVKEAKLRLRNPQLSIKEISSSLGFVNPSHFGTFIRRKTGKSPAALRESL